MNNGKGQVYVHTAFAFSKIIPQLHSFYGDLKRLEVYHFCSQCSRFFASWLLSYGCDKQTTGHTSWVWRVVKVTLVINKKQLDIQVGSGWL